MRVSAQCRSGALGGKPFRIELAVAVRDNPIARCESSLDLNEAVIPGSQSEVRAKIRSTPFDKDELRSLSADNGFNWNCQVPMLLAYDDIGLSKEILF